MIEVRATAKGKKEQKKNNTQLSAKRCVYLELRAKIADDDYVRRRRRRIRKNTLCVLCVENRPEPDAISLWPIPNRNTNLYIFYVVWRRMLQQNDYSILTH